MPNRLSILNEFEKKLKINFDNIKLLDVALTHSSYANGKKNIKFNERLEFLGDSVLQLCISEYLFKHCKNEDEGILTKTRALIVCENSLYTISQKWEIGKYIKMSKGEEMTGGRTRPSILSDCIEAIIAAVYIDKGLECSYDFIITNFKDIIEKALKNEIIMDYKTKLQEILQKKGEADIDYEVIKFEGPPHRRKFFVELTSNALKGYGEGYTKKQAQQNAAKCVLESLEGKSYE